MTVERKRNGHFIANLKPRKGSRHCLAALTSLISLSRTAIVSFLLSSRLHLVGISYLVEKSEAVRKDFSLSCPQTCLFLCPCSLAPLLNPPPITSQTWKSYAGHLLEDSPCLIIGVSFFSLSFFLPWSGFASLSKIPWFCSSFSAYTSGTLAPDIPSSVLPGGPK